MDLRQLFQMISRIFVRQAVNKGVNYMARRGKHPSQMTAADHQQAAGARAMVKRARQAARITRRLGR